MNFRLFNYFWNAFVWLMEIMTLGKFKNATVASPTLQTIQPYSASWHDYAFLKSQGEDSAK